MPKAYESGNPDNSISVAALENTAVKFIVHFLPHDAYNGEFGFDWMRDDYKTACEDYEKLKKEYTPIEINQKEYFVPWLSMFPNQENVKLKLAVTLSGTAGEQDIIKFPAQKGISFEPNEIKVSDTVNKEPEVTIICDTALNADLSIDILDKNDEVVGKINIFKNANHEQLHFDIIPVRILRGVSPEEDKEGIESMIDHFQGFGDANKDINDDLKNLQEYLNTQSLNQALLQCTIGEVYDVVIDEDKWIADDLIIDEGCVFKGSLLNKFSEEFKKQYNEASKKRGIIVYLSPLNNVGDNGSGGAGGYADLRDIDAKHLTIFYSNLWNKDSFAHEIAHVAGLEHSFKEDSDLEEDYLINYNKFSKETDDYINYMLDNNFSKNEIADFWKTRKDDYKYVKSRLNIHYRNLIKFKKGKTKNFMDYDTERKSFWKFQWKALQDDIIKFYNKK